MFLLLRASDHLIAGVTWVGVDPGNLVAVGNSAWMLLTLPPQHVAEQTFQEEDRLPGSGDLPRARSMLSGMSQVGVRLEHGSDFEPTAASILDMFGSAIPLGPADEPTTMVELPWHLKVAPRTRLGSSSAFRPASATAPVAAAAAGLWRLRVESGSETALVAVAEVGPETPDPFPMALERTWRARLVAETAGRPAGLDRMELSALGGSLAAGGVWDAFAWQHRAVLGRDMEVQVVANGTLYPFGHRAIYQRSVERVFDPSSGGAAVLRQVDLITVIDAVATVPADPSVRRGFPFDAVELTELVFPIRPPEWKPAPGSGDLDVFFRPMVPSGDVQFPVRCHTGESPVEFRLPLLFVADPPPAVEFMVDLDVATTLKDAFGSVRVPVIPSPVDLVRAAVREPEDVQEVHALTIAGVASAGQFAPGLSSLEIALPAVRSMVGAAESYAVTFSEDYLRAGTDARTVLQLVADRVGLDFAGRADKSGALVAPAYVADAISRTLGPVVGGALPDPLTGLVDVRAFFAPDATILGFPLHNLLGAVAKPPALTSLLDAGSVPVVSMEWKQVKLHSFAAFVATATTTLDLTVTVAPPTGAEPVDLLGNDTKCTITNFTLLLPPGKPLLGLHIDKLTFHQRGGAPPTVDIDGLRVAFLGELRLVEALGSAVDLAGHGPRIDVTPAGITADYTLELPEVAAAAFVLTNVAVRAGASIPFDRRPISVSLGFASPANRFALTVLMFGGGGYLEIELTQDGLRRIDLALEFGAMVALDFVVAHAEVHALGGVKFQLAGDKVEVSGYLRIGGCVDILGLVSVAIELCVTLTYRSETNALVGRATLVIEIDLFLWSDSIELDSGDWVLAGGSGRRERVARPVLATAFADVQPDRDAFGDYWSCFADEGGTDA
ncbi:hypothetical protein ACFWUU_05380 [Kribbella sp. NPDC058693]|uniref:hypothetical protein n=1 Tax=Kribbella sp. NPDC058693 TaxID=3346602 RepID=UPI00364F8C83